MTGWNFACADWEQRLSEGRSLVPDLPLFKDKADRAVRIFDKFCVPDIEGQPPFAVAAGEWFRDIVRVIFGSLDDEGVRHVPEVFALVGKKNSKTTSGAGLMVTALGERGPMGRVPVHRPDAGDRRPRLSAGGRHGRSRP